MKKLKAYRRHFPIASYAAAQQSTPGPIEVPQTPPVKALASPEDPSLPAGEMWNRLTQCKTKGNAQSFWTHFHGK